MKRGGRGGAKVCKDRLTRKRWFGMGAYICGHYEKKIDLRDQEKKIREAWSGGEEWRGVNKWTLPTLDHLGTIPMLRA